MPTIASIAKLRDWLKGPATFASAPHHCVVVKASTEPLAGAPPLTTGPGRVVLGLASVPTTGVLRWGDCRNHSRYSKFTVQLGPTNDGVSVIATSGTA